MRTFVLVVACLAAAAGAARADITLSDGEYGVADWAASISVATGGASFSTVRSTVGGNPDAYRRTVEVLPANSSITVANLYQAGSYDPAVSGAIYAIDYAEDRVQETPPFPGAFIVAAPLLEQGGVLYLGPDITFTNTAWGSVVRNDLVATDFTSATNTHPDFGPAGGILHFGYARSDANPGAVAVIFRSGIDNWSVKVRPGVLGADLPMQLEALRVLGPNPFTSSVAFRFGMREAGTARVSVHDASGRLVRTLAYSAYSAGSHALNWDGRDDAGRAIPAGLYFVSVEAAGTRASQRVVKLN